jgi:hypothetical protein
VEAGPNAGTLWFLYTLVLVSAKRARLAADVAVYKTNINVMVGPTPHGTDNMGAFTILSLHPTRELEHKDVVFDPNACG